MNRTDFTFLTRSTNSCLLALLIATFIISLPIAVAGDTLSISVSTDKAEYAPGDNVYVNGTVMWIPHQIPATDALVGIEVRNSLGNAFFFRTRPTGTIGTGNWLVNFTQLYPCGDVSGVPKYSFKRGENIWIYAQVENFDTAAHYAITCIALTDANSVPLGAWYPMWGTIPAGETRAILFQATTIPSTAVNGNATIFASEYSEFPKNLGYPYCPEKATTIIINGSTGAAPSRFMSQQAYLSSSGTYNTSFKLPSDELRRGAYTIFVSSYNQGQLATSNMTFRIPLIGDINNDGSVDIFDAIIMSSAFGSQLGDPNFVPAADLDSSGTIDVFDAIILASHYGDHD